MPITVRCTGCGQGLKVKDELVGKSVKCPGCGNPVKAVPPSPSVRKITVKGKEEVPKFHVSPKVIALTAVAIILPTLFAVWWFGPYAMHKVMTANDPQWQNDVTDVTERLVQAHVSHQWAGFPRRLGSLPKVQSLSMFYEVMYFSMPEKIGFGGLTTEGIYSGFYYPKTGEVAVDFEVDGKQTRESLAKVGATKISGTGRVKGGSVTVEINGKPIDIYIPPKIEE